MIDVSCGSELILHHSCRTRQQSVGLVVEEKQVAAAGASERCRRQCQRQAGARQKRHGARMHHHSVGGLQKLIGVRSRNSELQRSSGLDHLFVLQRPEAARE